MKRPRILYPGSDDDKAGHVQRVPKARRIDRFENNAPTKREISTEEASRGRRFFNLISNTLAGAKLEQNLVRHVEPKVGEGTDKASATNAAVRWTKTFPAISFAPKVPLGKRVSEKPRAMVDQKVPMLKTTALPSISYAPKIPLEKRFSEIEKTAMGTGQWTRVLPSISYAPKIPLEKRVSKDTADWAMFKTTVLPSISYAPKISLEMRVSEEPRAIVDQEVPMLKTTVLPSINYAPKVILEKRASEMEKPAMGTGQWTKTLPVISFAPKVPFEKRVSEEPRAIVDQEVPMLKTTALPSISYAPKIPLEERVSKETADQAMFKTTMLPSIGYAPKIQMASMKENES